MLNRAPARLMVVFFLTDVALSVAALWLARALRVVVPFGQPLDPGGRWLTFPVYVTALAVAAVALTASGLYDSGRIVRAYHELSRLTMGVIVEALVLAGVLYFTQRETSRLYILYFVLIQWCLLLTARLIARAAWSSLPTRRIPPRRVLVVGGGPLGRDVGARLLEQRWLGVEPVGFLDDSLAPGDTTGGLPVLGGLSDAVGAVRAYSIDDVVIALPLDAHTRLANLVAELQELTVDVKVVPDFLPLTFSRLRMETLGEMPLIGLKGPALSLPNRIAKRALDIVLSTIALIVAAPFLPIIALAIRLDTPGPVIFRHERVGQNERRFWMLKFRTMITGAEKQEEEIIGGWESGRRNELKPEADPRVTRVGRFLRRTSLDELPQLFNVLRGDMSLVGPRPEMPALAKFYEPWQRKRFALPQGLTGWWQVQHRGVHPIFLHAEDDLYYFRNYSLLLDIQILLRTVVAIVRRRGAH